MSARSFWPPIEAAQIDYETLRMHALESCRMPEGLAAARFARRGLAGLITWPSAEPIFVAELLDAPRPAWTPTRIPAWRHWPRAMNFSSTPPARWVRRPDYSCRTRRCGEGGAVCAGIHRAPG